MRPILAVLSVLPLLAFGECTSGPDEVPEPVEAPDYAPGSDPAYGTCLAFAGNGPRMPAHFGAVARIVEHYGLIGGVAGGSSGSISSYLVSSVQANPALYECGGTLCTEPETTARAALLFKTVPAYFQRLQEEPLGRAFATLGTAVSRAQSAGIPGLLQSNPLGAAGALHAVLTSSDLRALMDEETLGFLMHSPDPIRHVRDIWEIASSGLSFTAPDARIFLVPGLLDWDEVAWRLGRIGSFYAGWAPTDAVAYADLLDACAGPTRGMDWTEVADVVVEGRTCGDRFDSLLDGYLSELAAADRSVWPNRAESRVGDDLPALLSTGVLEGDAADRWSRARDDWEAATPWSLDLSFDDVKVGYWGHPADTAAVLANPEVFTDAKTARATDLGQGSWLEAMALSPAEPGLSRGVELEDGRVSVGGWADPAPVQALRNLGCEQVVYVNRRGDVGWFVRAVTGHLGMDAEDEADLWDLDVPGSGMWTAIDSADGVWCTDWDTPDAMDSTALFAEGWNAPFRTDAAVFTDVDDPYANLDPTLDLEGCALPAEEPELPVARCGDTLTGDTRGGTARWDGYACRVGNYAAPESAWTFTVDAATPVSFALLDPAPMDLDHDVFVLEGTQAGDCVVHGFHTAEFEAVPGRTYTLVVDGTGPTQAGGFQARVECGD